MCRPLSFLIASLCCFFPAESSLAQDGHPISVDWTSISKSELNLQRFLDAPAGKNGFIKPHGEQFVDDNGKRIRIWGVNLGATRCFPTHEEAERLADVLAAVGINCVRFHGMDSRWGLNE